MAVHAPQLHLVLRSFCLGAFVFLGRALEEGDDLPFAFEEHVQRGGPALYEYRPLVRSFVESRANALAKRDDALIALDELLREPAAAIFARAHAGPTPTEEQALFRTVLLSLLISTAESCGGNRRARSPLARGAGTVAPRLRARGRPLLRARAGARARGRRGAARRACRARRRGLRDPPRDRGTGSGRARPVRASGLAPVRDQAGAPDRRDAAAGRGDEARLVPRRADP